MVSEGAKRILARVAIEETKEDRFLKVDGGWLSACGRCFEPFVQPNRARRFCPSCNYEAKQNKQREYAKERRQSKKV